MLLRRAFCALFSILSTLSFLPAVLGTGLTGGFERVGPLYTTYRLAVAAWGKDQKKIMPGLADITGSHKDGGANFKEFSKYLDGAQLTDEFFKRPGEVAIDLDRPDPIETAKRVDYSDDGSEGKKLGHTVQLTRVFAGASEFWNEALEKVRTVLLEAHDELEKKGKLDSVKGLYKDLQTCQKEILVLRQSDMEGSTNGKGAMAKDIRQKWKISKVDMITTKWPHDNSIVIYKVDIDSTVKNNAAAFSDLEAVQKWVTKYGMDDTDNKAAAKAHYRVLKAHRENQVMIEKMVASCGV